MATPIFSILIPAIFERLESLRKLSAELERQIERDNIKGVEIVSVVDNRAVSIGAKRQAVLHAAHGDYRAFVDDDDWVADDYVSSIVDAIKQHNEVHVITFNQHAYIDSDTPALVTMRLGNPNENHNPTAYKRAAWHVNAWLYERVKNYGFPDTYYGEDWAWASALNDISKTEHHIDKPLHIYRFNSKSTRAFAPV